MRIRPSRALIPAALFAASLASAACAEEAGESLIRHLRRGVNILGYDGLWKGEVDNPFRLGVDMKRIRDAGFDHVRVNFFGLQHAGRNGKLDEKVLRRLDGVLDQAAAEGLWVVLDQHDSDSCDSEPESCKGRLASFWRQIAQRYAGSKHSVAFEILNEPGWRMEYGGWNAVVSAALSEIRRVDPTRIVVVAALNNGAPEAVTKLQLPDNDRRLVVTVHYYNPMRFTHQGAPWSADYRDVHGVAWGAPASREKVVNDLRPVADWARQTGRPIYLGEFGVIDSAPPLSRAAWTRHLARTAESFGWGWAYWQFDHDFALTDEITREWKQPLLDALMK
ncbi:glycoside hydrolase family 5 protein [Methylocystis parvus]|uniref:glycoside hydrolase family 5 protein n=1 Tax=Methylocystis parvus TaxID=134 RepID=UPI003C76A47B